MRDRSYYENRAKEIIGKIHYLTLATTSAENIPWNSPLAYSVDNNFNFYFGSSKESQHAHNIRNNEKGFVVIYDSTAPDGEGEGVYMTAKVRELSDAQEIQDAINAMFGKHSKYKIEHFTGESNLRAYKIEPITFWMNDTDEKEGLFFDYRVQIKPSLQ